MAGNIYEKSYMSNKRAVVIIVKGGRDGIYKL